SRSTNGVRTDPGAGFSGRSRADAADRPCLVPRGNSRRGPAVLRVRGERSTRLRLGLQIDPHYSEARIYLANMLYDRGETEAGLHHLHQTVPEDHYDELGIW